MTSPHKLSPEKRREFGMKVVALFVVFLFLSSMLLSAYSLFTGG